MASSVQAGARRRFGERMLGPLTHLLGVDTADAAMAAAPHLFASVSGGTAAVFGLEPGGEIVHESWDAPGEADKDAVRPHFLKALAKARGSEEPVVRMAGRGEGALRIWVRMFCDASSTYGAVCLAAPRSTPLGDPPDWGIVSQLVDFLAARVVSLQELGSARRERDQQDRYFTTLDQQLRMLERERQKFVAVVNQSDTYAIVVDGEYRVNWTNTSTSDRLADGGDDAQWIGRPLADVWKRLGVHGPDPGGEGCPVGRAFSSSEVVHHELQARVEEERRELYLTALPVRGPAGPADEVLVMIQDLTNLESLRRSESRYRLLFERSPDAMLMVEPGTRDVVLANPAAGRLLGRTLEDLQGMPVQSLHDPNDWKDARREYAEAFEREDVATSERSLLHSSGEKIDVVATATRFDFEGSPVALVEFQDVTEKRRLEAELRHSQKMEAVGRLAGGVAHDFNNLLAVIQGQAEILISRLTEGQGLRGTAESVRKAAVRGSLLTRQLLAFSRKDVLKPEVLDLRDVLHGVEAMLRSLVGGHVKLHLESGDEACRVEADRGQLEQVMMNLAANARDALPDGGHLWISVQRADREEVGRRRSSALDYWVLLQVRDDGVGMDDLTQSRLFEPFFTTKQQGRGTGLGLSSVYAIVQECGGTIDVDSVRGEGTTFSIHLPRVPQDTPSERSEVSTSMDLLKGTETVLVVEDEDEVREMAVEALKMMDYHVLPASSGAEALKVLESEQRVDLLLTDVIMPGIGGGDLVRKALPLRPELKVVYMSGYTAEDSMVAHGVTASRATFLQKPFSLDGLSRKVRDALDSGGGGLSSGRPE